MFYIKAEKANLSVEQEETLTSGAQNVYLCQFQFGKEWEDMNRTAVFVAGDKKVHVLLGTNNICTIPWEVLERPGQTVSVSVYGTKNGTMVLPSRLTKLGTVYVGASLGEEAKQPTPDLYSQILAAANKAEQAVEQLQEDLQNGVYGTAGGSQGAPGAPAVLISHKTEYQTAASGVNPPIGEWSMSIPLADRGEYLWTRTTLIFNSGDPVVSYSISRMGMDGSGNLSSVNKILPDSEGNITLTAGDLDALSTSGGSMIGPINMQGQAVTGLNVPIADTDAVCKSYVDAQKTDTFIYLNTFPRPNLLDNWYLGNPVNQRGKTSYTASSIEYSIDRFKHQNATLTVKPSCINWNSLKTTVYKRIMQQCDTILKAGYAYTISCLCNVLDVKNAVFRFTSPSYGSVSGAQNVSLMQTGEQLLATTLIPESDIEGIGVEFLCYNSADSYLNVDIYAMKLEIGDTQTLAHWDKNGYWVLNETPDYNTQQRKCKWYYNLWKNEAARTDTLSEKGNMRLDNPTIGNIALNGTIYYFASAEL